MKQFQTKLAWDNIDFAVKHQPKIWLKSYPKGVPDEIDLRKIWNTTLKDLIEESCETHANLPAYTNMGVTLTYKEVEEKSRCFASYLQNILDLQRGNKVALMMPNILQYPIARFGALRAGLTVINVNPEYTPRELEHQLKDSGAKVIVVLENFAKTLEEVLDKVPIEIVITTKIGDLFPAAKGAIINFLVKRVKKMVPEFNLPKAITFNEVLKLGSLVPELPETVIGSSNLAFLQYTGGTTGSTSKGVMLRHSNILANIEEAKAWINTILNEDEKEVVITALPLYHVFALVVNDLLMFSLGAHNILITNPRDLKRFVKEIKKTKFTVITGVNTLFAKLVENKKFKKVDFSKIKLTIGGGMKIYKDTAEKWKSVTGIPIIEGYGLTESSSAATINPLTNAEYNGSVGLPLPSTEISIRDEQNNILPPGKNNVGEICIRGPQVATMGYWQKIKETQALFTEDSWLKTGDAGYMDENGYIYISDRIKDMLLVSGFNVYPNEVEDAINTHPKVKESAVIGVPDPDEIAGDIVKVFVVKLDPSLTENEVRTYARTQLAAYKVPKIVEFRDDLPKTNIGKVLRRKLKEETNKSSA